MNAGRTWRRVLGVALLTAAGAARAERLAVRSYSTADGLPGGTITRIFRDSKGFLWFLSREGAVRFDGYAFVPFREDEGGVHEVNDVAETRDGDLWLAAGAHLRRLKAAADDMTAGTRVTVFPLPEGRLALRLQVDAAGALWCGSSNGLLRVDRAGEEVRFEEAKLDLPHGLSDDARVVALADDGAGGVWAGAGSGLYRLRGDGGVSRTNEADGLPARPVRDLAASADGTLWVATVRGLARVRPGTAGSHDAVVATYGTAEGLPTLDVGAIHAAQGGGLWIATPAGLSILAEGRITNHGAASGIGGPVFALEESVNGDFWLGSDWGVMRVAPWFGTGRSLARDEPSGLEPGRPPRVFVTDVRVGGAPHTAAGLAALSLAIPDVAPDRNVQIEFTSPARLDDASVRYEYRLAGATEWSRRGTGRIVDFASLSPGRYRFEVRAVAGNGAVSAAPATVRFRVLAPVWRRPWFFVLALAAVAGAAWGAFRYRLRSVVALERVRTRIAADLHDDIGSSLSRIAILSEVVKRQTAGPPEASRMLTEIAETSRQLVDTMSDIVWSIDPRRDDLKNVLARIGQFASGAAAARGIHWRFDIPPDARLVRLTPEQRRGMFLVLKEAVANALKHSGCKALALEVAVAGPLVTAEVRDDGCGLPPLKPSGGTSAVLRGRGLVNMRIRAEEIGAALTFTSEGGSGTVVRLEVPHRGKAKA